MFSRARIGWGILGILGSTGLTVSGLINPPVGYALLVLMVPVFLGFFWPWIKRWRPFTLAPANGNPPQSAAALPPTDPDEVKQLRVALREAEQRIEVLKSENELLSDSVEGRRRKRIENWRRVISDFNFDWIDTFGHTQTYAEMKPYLRPEVVKMFEKPRTVVMGNPARGETAYRYTLLDEVARIEREWKLI